MENTLVELKKVHQYFQLDSGGKIKVLMDINLSFNKNEILVLLGPSGSGKSTCLRIMAGLLKPTQGKVLLRGEPLEAINQEMSMVFQSFALLPWLTVNENIEMGIKSLRLSAKDSEDRVAKAIHLVGLEGFGDAYPKELSGGMKQRVGIARALVMERPMLCLDEPFSALDVLTGETLRKEVVNLWMSKKTSISSVLMITHNITEAISMGTRILVMGTNPGQIRYTIKNDLPFPRDEKTVAFRTMVENVHDVLTETLIPDTPEWVPPALADSTIETIPSVPPGDIIALLERLNDEGGRAGLFALSQKMMKDSVHILLITKATELLEFVDTPRNQVAMTTVGKAMIQADLHGRKQIFRSQLMLLKLTQNIMEAITNKPGKALSSQDLIALLHDWLPNENPTQVFEAFVQWGRYADFVSYDSSTEMLELS